MALSRRDLSLAANVVLLPPAALGAFVLGRRLLRARRQRRTAAPATPPVPRPIPRVTLPELDPVFTPDELGPTVATEVRFVGKGHLPVHGGTTDPEAWLLAVLARGARRMFEFGTCTGKTAYLWAVNSPPDARVTTLTLPPEGVAHYQRAPGDDDETSAIALQESTHTRFLYTGTAVEPKVEQLFGDSKAFDETPYLASCDLIFVDGSHAYSYVASDSAKALRMVRPGGLVLWHDYYWPTPHAPGVSRALHELAERLPLVQVEGTALVAYRRPR